MINLLKYNNNARKIAYNGYSLLMVSHINELKNEQLEYLDGFIIDTEDIQHARDILKQLRILEKVKIGLLPIFINSMYKLSKSIEIHSDGAVDINMSSSYIQRVLVIKKRINQLIVPELESHQELIKFKILAFCFTRNKTISPIASRDSLIGYEFPYISLLFKSSEMISMLSLLNKLSEDKLLTTTLDDYVHLCKSCASSYVNFRECCPKCDSIDIKPHDMVHHFVCAHVAPEKDFKVEDGLECPKCNKQLRHIGIDYDKPSTIYSCNTCNHEFQNTNMKALCIDCETEHELDELLEKAIQSYSLTQKGENQVISIDKSNSQKQEYSIGNVSLSLFRILLKQEIQRVKTTNCNSYFVEISFQNKQLQLLNADVKKELTKEIAGIIKSYLKEADVLNSNSFNYYYLLLPETREDQLERLENIQYNLSKLLSDNIENIQQKIEIRYDKITPEKQVHNFFTQ